MVFFILNPHRFLLPCYCYFLSSSIPSYSSNPHHSMAEKLNLAHKNLRGNVTLMSELKSLKLLDLGELIPPDFGSLSELRKWTGSIWGGIFWINSRMASSINKSCFCHYLSEEQVMKLKKEMTSIEERNCFWVLRIEIGFEE
jgi:hypothetical protein